MKKLIAIIGMAGSGKGIATDYLEKKGFTKIYFGGVIYDKMKEAGISITPDSQKKFREEIRKKHGPGVIAYFLLDKITKAYEEGNCVLDGIYSWDELLILKEKFQDSLKVISICCDKELRYHRIANRVERPFTKEEVIKRDISEIENMAKGGPIAYADYYILNNTTIEDYYQRLEEILEIIERQEGEK